MKFLDITFDSAAENLACDEVLLDQCEAQSSSPILRFWEARQLFVVAGYANRLATEVNLNACQAENVPVYRRCSGGGTVLQAAGCLNYSLILAFDETGPVSTIPKANSFIMERHRATLQQLTGDTIEIQGSTDLSCRQRKFSGNSQRRRRRALLFHGTFLLGMNLDLISQFLHMPSAQPTYRHSRSHAEFLCNLPLSMEAVKAALRAVWQATTPLSPNEIPLSQIRELAVSRYETAAWNSRF